MRLNKEKRQARWKRGIGKTPHATEAEKNENNPNAGIAAALPHFE
jgi:hypothetical protein